MNKSYKWFTLVELIVVMLIITVLSTMWFISYTWYLEWSRDTKRHSDIVTLNNSIKNLAVKWFNLSVLVDTTDIDRTWNWDFYNAWKNITWETIYKAWWINFNYLIDLSEELVDPKTFNSYIIWVYKNTYELASSLEETNTSYILRNNKLRTSSWTVSSLKWTIDTINNNITLLNREDTIKFRIWDYIWTWSTSSNEIIDIIWDKIYLNDVTGFSVIDKISLFKDDTSLIWNVANWDGTSTDCIVTTNVQENKCPIEEQNKWLLPYKFN